MLLQPVYTLPKKAMSVGARMKEMEMETHHRLSIQMADPTSRPPRTPPHRLALVARDVCLNISEMEALGRVGQAVPKP